MSTPRDSKLTDEELLGQLLETYEASRGKGSQSYRDYMRTRGQNPAAVYDTAMAEAYRLYDHAKAGYGVDGEQLAAGGGASGYAAYLNALRNTRLAERQKDAANAQREAVHANESGYASYLKSLSEKLRTTVNGMRDQQIRQYNDAYAYTLAAGFDSDTAHLAAELVGKMEAKPLSDADKNTRIRLLREMVDLCLPRDAAYNYALSCGMSAEAATELADMCTSVLEGRDPTRYQ